MNTMDKMLLVLMLTVLSFVVAVLVYNYRGIQVQDSLINTFMLAVTGELAAMGGIKMFKVKHGDKAKTKNKKGSKNND